MNALTLTPTQARRLAITRQRLAGPPPAPTRDGILELFRNLGCVQIDPIRAVERTQYLVLWSRVGNYNPAHLHTLLWDSRHLFEYWAHAASIVLTEDYQIHHHYMRRFAAGQVDSGWHQRVQDWLVENTGFREYVLARLHAEGPLAISQLEDRSVRPWASDGWNQNRNLGQMLSFLWEQGDIMVAGRKGIERLWGLTADHLPEWTPREPLPAREITRRAAQKSLRALGVGTAKHIANHFTRNRYPELDSVLAELVAAAEILPAQIADWPGRWYIHAADVPLLNTLADDNGWQPRTTLLSPFDNLICDRDRTEQMWDFFFRIEIYVPPGKRQYGYYVLPILHGDRLIGRLDPRLDRKTHTLHINAVYAEPAAPPDAGPAVAAAISELAQFLAARRIVFTEKVPPFWQAALQ